MTHHPKRIVIDARIRRSSTGRYADRLIEHLQNIDRVNQYTILVEPDDPWQPSASNFSSLPCPFPQFSFNPSNDFKFARQLKSLKPDLVHFTMTQQPAFYRGNIVTTTHDLTMFKFARAGQTPLPIFWLKMIGYRLLFWWSHRKSSRIIVPTNYVKEDLSKYMPSTNKKIVVTYEASEPPTQSTPQKPSFADNTDKFLLYVGTAFPHINLPNLVRAFSLLQADNPSLKLFLVGKKEYYYQQLDDFIKSQPALEPWVYTTDFVDDNELAWLYKHAQAFVFPSLSEGFGLPGLEAMAHGCPLVSSNATCLPEVYGNAAVYFDPQDTQEIAKAISQVLKDSNLHEKLVKSGYKQVKQYSWSYMAKQTLEAYKAVLIADS